MGPHRRRGDATCNGNRSSGAHSRRIDRGCIADPLTTAARPGTRFDA